MTGIIILTIIAAPIFYLLVTPSTKRQTELPPDFDVGYEPEKIPIYTEFRRVQQALSRKSRVVEDQIREIGLGKQELAIGNLLLAIGNKHLEVKSDIIAADEKALDTTKREMEALMRWNEAELKEKATSLLLTRNDLQAMENEVSKKFGLLELKEGELKLLGKGLDLDKQSNDIENRLALLEIDRKDLGLVKKEILLERFHNKNLEELASIALGKRELQLGQSELEHLYKVRSFQLETTIQNIKHMHTDLQLERKAWKNEQKEVKLNLYRQELNNLDKYIRQMYDVKMNWLRIQERENNISYKEDKLALQDLYNNTMTKLDSLRLQKWENGLIMREDEVARKNLTLSSLAKSWLK